MSIYSSWGDVTHLKPVPAPQAGAIGKRFANHGPEEEKLAGKAAAGAPQLEKFRQAWGHFNVEDFLSLRGIMIAPPTVISGQAHPSSEMDRAYGLAAMLLGRHRPSASDVEAFSVALTEYRNDPHFQAKAGIFLSAMINRGSGRSYFVNAAQLGGSIAYLGMKNTRRIDVEGDVSYPGVGMQRGCITINGRIGTQTTRPYGGVVRVNDHGTMSVHTAHGSHLCPAPFWVRLWDCVQEYL